MQLHVVAVAIATACFVTGCGFIPKSPPTPSGAQRIPINQAAPYIGPWPPPTYAAAPHTPEPVSEVPAKVEPKAVEVAATQPESAPSRATTNAEGTLSESLAEPVAEASEPLAWWPITVPFHGSDSLQGANKKLPARNVTFAWPKPVAHHEPQPQPEAAQPATPDSQKVDVLAVTGGDAVPAQALAAIEPEKTANATRPEPQATAASKAPDKQNATGPSAPEPQIPAAQSLVPEAEQTVTAHTTPDEKDTPEPSPEPETEPVMESTPKPVHWSASRGVTLSDLLREWGNQAQWTVYWESALDFRIEAAFSIEAPNFLGAVNKILRAYRDAGRTITAKAYSNQVLVVNVPSD